MTFHNSSFNSYRQQHTRGTAIPTLPRRVSLTSRYDTSRVTTSRLLALETRLGYSAIRLTVTGRFVILNKYIFGEFFECIGLFKILYEVPTLQLQYSNSLIGSYCNWYLQIDSVQSLPFLLGFLKD